MLYRIYNAGTRFTSIKVYCVSKKRLVHISRAMATPDFGKQWKQRWLHELARLRCSLSILKAVGCVLHTQMCRMK
jgi:hypothetical protein